MLFRRYLVDDVMAGPARFGRRQDLAGSGDAS